MYLLFSNVEFFLSPLVQRNNHIKSISKGKTIKIYKYLTKKGKAAAAGAIVSQRRENGIDS